MKNIKYRILIGLCVFLYIYLMSSFFESSFNIKDWSEATRFTTSLFGGILTIILPLMIPEDSFKNK